MRILKYDNVKWNLPFLFTNSNILDNLVGRTMNVEDGFIPVSYVHGCVDNIWNGEENAAEIPLNRINFANCLQDKSIVPVFTFSAYNIDDEMLKDEYSNTLLDLAMENNAQIEVSSDKLFNHIKSRYPRAELVASAVKSVYELPKGDEVNYYNRLLDNYERVVLSPQYVKEKFLEDSHKFTSHRRLEIVVNDKCILNCPSIKGCLESVENNIEFTGCPKNALNNKELFDRSLALSEEEIEKILLQTEVRNLRLKGRNIKPDIAKFLIANYMLKGYGVSSFYVYELS